MQELLGNSQYGLITEDSVEGIYAGMKKMLEDPHLRERYARAAKLRGKAFSKAERIAETENFFRSFLEEKQKH
jgi:glycosyltransferase involved in cell wall biosynthesis